MRKKLLWVAVGLLAVILCTVLAFAAVTKNQTLNLPQQELRTINLSGDKAACTLTRSNGVPSSYFGSYVPGMRTVTYMDPSVLCASPQYPLQLNSITFTLYGFTGAVWPVTVDVVVFAMANSPTVCAGPGAELCRFTITCTQAQFAYPNLGTANFPTTCCVKGPFFVGLEYMGPAGAILPSILYDNTPFTDSCSNWMYYDAGTGFVWYEWYNFWNPPAPGYPIISLSAQTASANCPVDSLYYKAGYPDYCPFGMPDFDQKQNGWQMQGPMGLEWTYCGPTAVANCLWWFDSKYEPTPIPPPAINDHFGLVQAFGNWDDHAPQNVIPFISDMGMRMFTDQFGLGTNVNRMQYAISHLLWERYVDSLLFEHTVKMPEFTFIEKEIERCQDVILLLGFWQQQGPNWVRIGGHYVTCAGVNSQAGLIAISDPYLDHAEGEPPAGSAHPSALHNDAAMISGPHGTNTHDVYPILLQSPSPGGIWWLPTYPADPSVIPNFFEQNVPDEFVPMQGTYNQGLPVHTEVEYAVLVSPYNWYFKPDTTYGPNGMNDFPSQLPCHSSVAAVDNCLWWYGINDYIQYGTPIKFYNFLDSLFGYPAMYQPPESPGIAPHEIELALDVFFTGSIEPLPFKESTFPRPIFKEMADSLMKCQDVILLIGYWWQDPQGAWWREAGRYVTMAGVDTVNNWVALSDPEADNAELTDGPGVVQPLHPTHPPQTVDHFNPGWISHDFYSVTMPSPSPGGLWDIAGFSRGFSPVGANCPPEFVPFTQANPQGQYAYSYEVEYAVVICPRSVQPCDCIPGDADGSKVINVSDVVYLIGYVFNGAPVPTPYALCSGDANCDCIVNVSDVVYLISYIFAGGPAPCDCAQWLINCGPPLR